MAGDPPFLGAEDPLREIPLLSGVVDPDVAAGGLKPTPVTRRSRSLAIAFPLGLAAFPASAWAAISRRHSAAGTAAGARCFPASSRPGSRASGTISTSGQTVDVYVDMLALGQGRTVSAVVVSSFEEPVARSFELRLAPAAARRMS